MINRIADRLHRDDSGATAVLVALFVVFIVLPVSAVSVDLSNAYANRRQMQNAADAAAQAGAQTMASGTATAAAIDKAAKDVAQANGVDTTDAAYTCQVVVVSYSAGVPSVTQATPCTSWTATGGYNAVRVQSVHAIQAFFAPALGLLDGTSGTSSTTATATATAAIQKVYNQYLGDAIFAMCSYDDGKKPDPSWIPLLTKDPVTGLNSLNTAAIGHRYVIWSNGGGSSNLSRCGLGGSAFDGRICGMAPDCTQPVSLPGWLAINTGAAVGPTLATMAGYPACDPNNFSGTKVSFTACAMVLPVCSGSNTLSGTNGELYCDELGEFLLSPGVQDSSDSSCTFMVGTSDTICGEFLGAPQAGGTPVTGTPGPNDAYRVALVQ